ncbi:hypothetical protein PHISCL_01877 [Aspergillus sclerotialis]|uniref:Glycine cleavage system H protein n=1 Tax=Aspergillus sclerotialis TaxID=2070753 RepID=A0A3A3A251_9EURO|nr:hypothetical protein PHISCL_01877 [Aspergillus sclerotialis]
MAAVARSIRPLASRMLSQRAPIAASCRVSPVAGFPRGSVRCFSQSPLCMIVLPIHGLDGHDVELTQLKKYTDSHEWIELAEGGKTAKIGITEHAANSLGDVVFVELAEEGREVSPGEPVGAVESVKSASDVLSPVTGKVIQGNTVLEDNAKLINQSAEKDAWIAEIEVHKPDELEGLLDEAAYKETVASE